MEGNFNYLLFKAPLDEAIVSLKLGCTLLTKPFSNLHQLLFEYPLLLSTDIFDLNVALEPEKLLNVVDGLSIDFVEIGSVFLMSPSLEAIYISGKNYWINLTLIPD